MHSYVNGEMNGEAIKQHTEKAQLTLYVLPSPAAMLHESDGVFLLYHYQSVFACTVYGSVFILLAHFFPT